MITEIGIAVTVLTPLYAMGYKAMSDIGALRVNVEQIATTQALCPNCPKVKS